MFPKRKKHKEKAGIKNVKTFFLKTEFRLYLKYIFGHCTLSL